jgi:hypothetical protein
MVFADLDRDGFLESDTLVSRSSPVHCRQLVFLLWPRARLDHSSSGTTLSARDTCPFHSRCFLEIERSHSSSSVSGMHAGNAGISSTSRHTSNRSQMEPDNHVDKTECEARSEWMPLRHSGTAICGLCDLSITPTVYH